VTQGNEEGGRRAMENILAATRRERRLRHQRARGGRRLPGAPGHGHGDDVLIVAVDGGCAGVQNVQEGVIGATRSSTRSTWPASGIEAIARPTAAD
jgi:fructose transport system substrate-binding protein